MAAPFQISIDRLTGLLRQFEFDGMSGFPLADGRAGDGKPVRGDILDLQTEEIAASELAVDCEVEHGEVAEAMIDLQFGSDRPNLLGL